MVYITVHHCTPSVCRLSLKYFTLVTAMYTIVRHCTLLIAICLPIVSRIFYFGDRDVHHCTPLIAICLLQSENILGKNCVILYIASITSTYHELILKQTIASVLNAIDFNVVFVVKSYAPSTTTIAAYVGIE